MKKMSVALSVLLPGLVVLPVSAEEEWVDLTHDRGAGLYGEKCGMCHRPGGMGHGILSRRLPADQASLEERRDIQPELIRTAVREGFGVMFPLSRAEVSDGQLEAIVDYLVRENDE